MKQTVYQQIADFVHNTTYEDLSPELIKVIKNAFIDFVGVCLLGSTQNSVFAAIKYAAYSSEKEEAYIFGHSKRTSVEFAAMINAISGHVLDFDDVSMTTIGHPSVVVAPVCFSLSLKYKLSGKDMILAYAIATEVMHKLALTCMPTISEKGWHTTPVFGIFGALIAAAKIKKSSKEEIINALGLCTSKASGIRANFGTDAKSYHAGMACYNALEALNLASFGMTSSSLSFEGTDGFLQLFTNSTQDKINLKLGKTWDLIVNGLVFKLYPCCSGSHPAADLIKRINKIYTFDINKIKKIVVGCSLLAPKELKCNFPKNALEAKFSMRYAITSMLIYGKLGLEEFTDKKVCQEKIQSFMKKIEISVDDEYSKLGFIGTSPTRVKIFFYDTDYIIEDYQLSAKGNLSNPLSLNEIKNKFNMCTKGFNNSDELFKILCNLDNYSGLNTFFSILSLDKIKI